MSIDLTGSIHGKLQVLRSFTRASEPHRELWRCKCLRCDRELTIRPKEVSEYLEGCGKCQALLTEKINRASDLGSIHGKLKILSFGELPCDYNVQCLVCNKIYPLRRSKVINNHHGCTDCTRVYGPKSTYWSGGKFISATFLSSFKNGANRRGIDFSLTIDDLDEIWESQNGCCAYSGIELVIGSRRVKQTASLDRIDSMVGYQKGNVQFVHKDINQMKWTFTEERFLELVRLIAKEHKL